MKSEVGDLIRVAREKKGISQTQAGRLLKFSEQFLGRIEAGDVPCPLVRAKKIQKVLNIKQSHLLGAYVNDYTNKISNLLATSKKRSR